MTASDVNSLVFVDPSHVDERWRVCIYAAPGSGKTVAACSAPGPIVAVNADRPGAYRFARRHYPGKPIHEVRFRNLQTVRDTLEWARGNQDEIGTVVLDPFGAIYDTIVSDHTHGKNTDWQGVNKAAIGIITSFRALDVNLIVVAHERVEKDENADIEAKIYPQLGGPALVQKIMAEMDVVARIFHRDATESAAEAWMGQFVSARGYQCKDSSGALGRARPADVSEWIATANGAEEPVPWDAPADPVTVDAAGNPIAF